MIVLREILAKPNRKLRNPTCINHDWYMHVWHGCRMLGYISRTCLFLHWCRTAESHYMKEAN